MGKRQCRVENLVKADSLKETLEATYRDKTVLVTGHTGFKGAWLSTWLNTLGARVIGYSLEPPSKPSLFEACGLEKKVNHLHGDIRDLNRLESVFKGHRPDFLFHLAAQSLVRRSYAEPVLTYETNMMGTVNVLEALRSTNCVRVAVIATSDKCYENKELDRPFVEDDPMGGYDPYSSSKGCAEIITSAYRRSYFNPDRYDDHRVSLSTVRAGNVIGGGDWGQDRLVPDCVRALSSNKPIEIRNPDAVRPWQHVLDCLFGYLLLGAKMDQEGPRFSASWNLGQPLQSAATVKELVQMVIRCWGDGSFVFQPMAYPNDRSNTHEAGLLHLDCSKANTILQWCPLYKLDQAVEKTVAWYRMFYSGVSKEKLFNHSVELIKEYMRQSFTKNA
jgi:CDP-glucose 4,6-dehydratase